MGEMRITTERATAAGGGSSIGVVISAAFVQLLDQYSRMETFVKLTSYIVRFEPFGILFVVALGFALVIVGTNKELKRLAAVSSVSRSGVISPSAFEWYSIKGAGLWATATALLLTISVIGVAFATVPALAIREYVQSPPSADYLARANAEAVEAYAQRHSIETSGLKPPVAVTNINAPTAFVVAGQGTVHSDHDIFSLQETSPSQSESKPKTKTQQTPLNEKPDKPGPGSAGPIAGIKSHVSFLVTDGATVNSSHDTFGVPPSTFRFVEEERPPQIVDGKRVNVTVVRVYTDFKIDSPVLGILSDNPINYGPGDVTVNGVVVEARYNILSKGAGVVEPNSLGIILASPLVFTPLQEIAIPINSIKRSHVLSVLAVDYFRLGR